MKFVASWMDINANDIDDDVYLPVCRRAASSMNACLEELYGSDLWLGREKALQISEMGLSFMQDYMTLATRAYDRRQALFSYMPKAHVCHHVFIEMRESASKTGLCLNPLCQAVQVDEDMVGKTSRLARRVSPMQVVKRVLNRWLHAAFKHWTAAGFIRGR